MLENSNLQNNRPDLPTIIFLYQSRPFCADVVSIIWKMLKTSSKGFSLLKTKNGTNVEPSN